MLQYVYKQLVCGQDKNSQKAQNSSKISVKTKTFRCFKPICGICGFCSLLPRMVSTDQRQYPITRRSFIHFYSISPSKKYVKNCTISSSFKQLYIHQYLMNRKRISVWNTYSNFGSFASKLFLLFNDKNFQRKFDAFQKFRRQPAALNMQFYFQPSCCNLNNIKEKRRALLLSTSVENQKLYYVQIQT